MVVYEPKQRWEADEALAHAYFDPVRDLQLTLTLTPTLTLTLTLTLTR